MADMYVKLLLDFVKSGRAGKEARDELKGIKTEADRLKAAGGPDRLNRSLGETSSKGRKLAGDLAKAKAEAKALAATDARPRVSAYNGLKDMARPKDRAKDLLRNSAAGAAGAAMGGLGLAGVAGAGGAVLVAGQLVKTSMTLETAQKELAITTGETDQAVAEATNTFRKLAGAFGEGPTKMVQTAQLFAASGQDFNTAVAATAPSLKTAKASFSEITDVATAGIAAIQNLNVPVASLQEAYDRMAMSAKLGQVEMKNLAAELPGVAASYSKVGAKGLEGISDLTSQLQIMRKETSSAAEASNRLTNLYDKITAEETIKSFKEEGVDLQKEILAGEKKGITALDTTLGLIEKITRKKDGSIDPFKMTNLFGDMQARQAAMALIKYRDDVRKMRDQISKEAAGTVDRDFARASAAVQAGVDRLSAAFDTLRGRLGERLHPAVTSIAEAIGVPIEKLNMLLERLDLAAEKAKKLDAAAKRMAEGDATPEDAGILASDPEAVRKLAEAQRQTARDRNRVDAEATAKMSEQASPDDAVQLETAKERRNLEREIAALKGEIAAKGGKGVTRQIMRLGQLNGQLSRLGPAQAEPDPVGPNLPSEDAKARTAAELEKKIAEDRRRTEAELARLNLLIDNAPAGKSREALLKQRQRYEHGPADLLQGPLTKDEMKKRGTHGDVPVPSKMPLPPTRPADLRAAMHVDLQPAAESNMMTYVNGIRAGQPGVDGATQQIGEGVKGKLSAVDGSAAAAQAMSTYAQGIAAHGDQAVAEAQKVAARVQAALTVKVAGLGGGGVRARTGGALHDGVG